MNPTKQYKSEVHICIDNNNRYEVKITNNDINKTYTFNFSRGQVNELDIPALISDWDYVIKLHMYSNKKKNGVWKFKLEKDIIIFREVHTDEEVRFSKKDIKRYYIDYSPYNNVVYLIMYNGDESVYECF